MPDHVVFGFSFLLLALSLSIYPWAVFVNRVVCYFGKISFSCYLGHFFVVYVVLPKLYTVTIGNYTGSILTFLVLYYLVALIITLGLATTTYCLVELPGIALGKRLIRAIERHVPSIRPNASGNTETTAL